MVTALAKLTLLQIAVAVVAAPFSVAAEIGIGSNSGIVVTQRGAAKANTLTKPVVITRLKEIQRKQSQAIDSAAQSMRKLIAETQNIKIAADDAIVAERQLHTTTKRLAALREQKEEATLRYEFLEQLIFQFDSKWTNQPLAIFLEHQLLDMATTDLTSAQVNRGEVWRFYTNLSVAIREIPEPREDLLAFLDGYMEFSSIKNPKSPLQYLSSRHYTNGAVNQMATSTNRDDISAGIEKRLKDLEAIGVKNAEVKLPETTVSSGTAEADIEMRATVPAPQ